MTVELERKNELLRRAIGGHESLLVAYSGGVDSALVLRVAHDVLGQRAVGVTADSPSVPRHELDCARRIAATIGARHVVVKTTEIDDPRYAANPANRCYFCKSELYTTLAAVARSLGIHRIANGTNVDDLGDYRPGLLAADELEVVSPLRDAEMTKTDVRDLAREIGLETWDKPASPCLSSRIPYGSAVTRDKLLAVEQAEAYLRGLKIRELRVRHLGDTARIETSLAELVTVRSNLPTISQRFREIGFRRVELGEFRSGSLNTALDTAS